MAKRRQQNDDREVELQFPLEGIDDTRSFHRQRPGTTGDALNVRTFDPKTDRARGGSRAGLSKYCMNQVVGNYPIQDLNHLVTNDVVASILSTVGQFTYALTTDNLFGIGAPSTGSSIVTAGTLSGFSFICSCWDDSGNVYVAERNTTTGATKIYKYNNAGTAAGGNWPITGPTIPTGSNRGITGMVVANIGTSSYLFLAVLHTVAPVARIYKYDSNGNNMGVSGAPWLSNTSTGYTAMRFAPTASNNIGKCATTLAVDSCGTSTDQGLFIINLADGALLKYVPYGGTRSATVVNKVISDGFATYYVIASVTTAQVKSIGMGGTVNWSSAGAATATGIAFDFTNGLLLAATGSTPCVKSLSLTTGALLASADPGSVTSWTEIDGDNAGFFTLWRGGVASNDAMGINTTLSTVWGPSTFANTTHYGASVNKGKTLQASTGGNRKIRLLAVSNGEVRISDPSTTTRTLRNFAAITNGAQLAAHTPSVYSAQNGLNMFYVDGTVYRYYKSSTNALTAWTPTAGTMPVDTLLGRARLICTWRGRTVLAGLFRDPANWFMSKQFDAFNWNYSPSTTSETQACSGNDAPAGQVGDFINCMIPFKDDTLIWGCDHSIYQLTGDPMSGGQMDRISSLLGMAWGQPFCIDPMGQIYFFSTDCAVYKMTPGALPVPVSQQIRRRLQSIDLDLFRIKMAWDLKNQGFGMWVTPINPATETTNYFFEERTNSWWPDAYGEPSRNPMAVHEFDGDKQEDRVIMIGSQNGFVRILDNTVEDDDGVAIESFAVIGPLSAKTADDMILKMLQGTLGDSSGDVTWEVFVGETAETALASEAVASGTWSHGRNRVNSIRRSGFAVYVKLTSTDYWALEKVIAVYAPQGRVRRRG